MTRTVDKRVRKSPLLVSSLHKNWDTIGKQKMIRMSIRKLKKIGDPESLLCRAVLINNTLETVKNSSKNTNNTNLECSQYSLDEERILNTVRIPTLPTLPTDPSLQDNKGTGLGLLNCATITLPEPISPFSDEEDYLYPETSNLTNIQNNKVNCLEIQESEQFTNKISTCDSNNEYLLEDDRKIFNSYLSLCSSDLYDCKSIVAA